MTYKSVNPHAGELLQSLEQLGSAQLEHKLAAAHDASRSGKLVSLPERAAILAQAATQLHAQADAHARLATLEMGKRIGEVKFSAGILTILSDIQPGIHAFVNSKVLRSGHLPAPT